VNCLSKLSLTRAADRQKLVWANVLVLLEQMRREMQACQSTSKSRVKVSGFDALPPPIAGPVLWGHPRVTLARIAFGVGGRAKSRPATITLTKTVTPNALSRCFVCPERGIMLNSNYGM